MREPDEKVSLRIIITAGGRERVNLCLPIVDWSEPGLLHLWINGEQVTVPWDDTRAVNRGLAATHVPDEHKFHVRSEIARIVREAHEMLDRQLAGHTHFVIEASCPVVDLPVKRRPLLTFHAFLRSRRDEDSPVGDLARDAERDRRQGWRGHVTPDSLRARITARGGCDEALDAVDEVERAWRRS